MGYGVCVCVYMSALVYIQKTEFVQTTRLMTIMVKAVEEMPVREVR